MEIKRYDAADDEEKQEDRTSKMENKINRIKLKKKNLTKKDTSDKNIGNKREINCQKIFLGKQTKFFHFIFLNIKKMKKKDDDDKKSFPIRKHRSLFVPGFNVKKL